MTKQERVIARLAREAFFAALRQSARDARATGQIATDSELEDRLSRIAFMERQDQ
jgi:hypothetical protein